MKNISILSVLFLLTVGIQTTRAQKQSSATEGKGKIILHLPDHRTVEYNVGELDSITYVNYESKHRPPVSEPLNCPDNRHPHAIDLGLPSGTKWCCCNVDATAPEGFGGYYAWGETEEKNMYFDVTYPYFSGQDTDGNGDIDENLSNINIGSDIAGTDYDVAHVRMGAPWRMPSKEQQDELRYNCFSRWTQQNGVSGYLLTGPNGRRIFLPAAGYRWKEFINEAGWYGYYWSSSLYPYDNYYASTFGFYAYDWNWFYGRRNFGLSVRPVHQ